MNDQEIFHKLVTEKLEKEGPMFDFDGNNCADSWEEGKDCFGWDGESRRCECGNRRVSWVLSDDKTRVYAEAY